MRDVIQWSERYRVIDLFQDFKFQDLISTLSIFEIMHEANEISWNLNNIDKYPFLFDPHNIQMMKYETCMKQYFW